MYMLAPWTAAWRSWVSQSFSETVRKRLGSAPDRLLFFYYFLIKTSKLARLQIYQRYIRSKSIRGEVTRCSPNQMYGNVQALVV